MKKVKKVTKYLAIVGENDELLNEYKSGMKEYDINSNLTKEVEYMPDGEVETASGFKYNDKNQLIEEMHYFEEGEVGEIVHYKLNEDGKPLEIETTYADGSISLKKAERNEHSLMIKSFDEDGDQEGKDVIKYNTEGKVIEESKFDEDGERIHHAISTYTKDQLIESKTVYGEKDEFLQKAVFEYDTKGNMIREVHLNRKDKPVNQITYKYNANNELVEWYNNQYLMLSKFDDEGRQVYEETRNRANNLVESFTEYKFDDDGRLIESRSFSVGEQYQLQPGVYTRGKLTFTVTKHEYEFFEED